MASTVDMMIHVADPTAKARLQAIVAGLPGVTAARFRSEKPRFLFVSYDPRVFDIRAIPRIARDIGTQARIVGA
jgi:hypothetical protein